ncbi:hypothetical protein [Cyanothece sp. BG0011]|uniref:hypothetical protein n=1 Tax=Cyanothece sp. BG0011 TaxID=2082950 RepID=UPI0018E59832|nr:hypothetical protein [Cyanothece sp. BG0011]
MIYNKFISKSFLISSCLVLLSTISVNALEPETDQSFKSSASSFEENLNDPFLSGSFHF